MPRPIASENAPAATVEYRFTNATARVGGRSRPEEAVPEVLPTVLGDFAILQIDPAQAGQAGAKSVYRGFFNEGWR